MVEIAEDVFGDVVTEWGTVSHSNETILLSGDFPEADGVEALLRAGERFLLVDERGVEYVDAHHLAEEEGAFFTPNYVSDPEPREDGILLYVDCKGGIDPAMRERFLAVLREELEDLPGAMVRATQY